MIYIVLFQTQLLSYIPNPYVLNPALCVVLHAHDRRVVDDTHCSSCMIV